MANQAQVLQPTFMRAETFCAHAYRMLGGYGWQTKLAPILCYSRTQVGRLGAGHAAISAPVAMSILALVDCHEKGIPLEAPEAVDADKSSYMTSDEFTRLGHDLFGLGWRTRMAEFLGYTRVQIGRFAGGQAAIPATIAAATRLMVYASDYGMPLVPLKPVGTIDAGGVFREVDAPSPLPENVAA